VAKNQKVIIINSKKEEKIRLYELVKSMPVGNWKPIKLSLDKPKKV
jgi:hypothetical protein